MKNKKTPLLILLSVIFLAGLALRLALLPEVSRDYDVFLSRWIKQFAQNGRAAFSTLKSDYNAPYLLVLWLASAFKGSEMLVVKGFSILCDAALCAGVFLLASTLAGRKKAALAAALVWILPTVFLNSAWWSQCDSLYTALCVFALWLLYTDSKYSRWISVALAGVAFALKLQTIFFLPVFIVALIIRKVKIQHALAFPVGFLAACLPGVVLGFPLEKIVGVYLTQAGEYTAMSLNSASLWSVLQTPDDSSILPALAIGLTILAILFVFFRAYEKSEKNALDLFDYALIFSCVIPFLLPHMHDRYFYMLEVFALVAAVCRKKYAVAALSQLAGIIVYHHYMAMVDEKWLAAIPLADSSAAAGALMAVAAVLVSSPLFSSTNAEAS